MLEPLHNLMCPSHLSLQSLTGEKLSISGAVTAQLPNRVLAATWSGSDPILESAPEVFTLG